MIYACALMTNQHGSPVKLHSAIPEHHAGVRRTPN